MSQDVLYLGPFKGCANIFTIKFNCGIICNGPIHYRIVGMVRISSELTIIL